MAKSITLLFEDYVAAYSTSDSKPSTVINSAPNQCEKVSVGRAESRLESQIKKQKE